MIAAAILAAGASRRLGRPKQLLPYGDTTLLGTIAERVVASCCDRVAVVLGAHADRIAPVLDHVELVMNPLWPEGVASSIRAASIWAANADALVLLVGDQPWLETTHVDALCAAYLLDGRCAGSRYGGVVAVPALFTAAELPRLRVLAGDTGARAVLAAAGPTAIDWPAGAVDLDTTEAMNSLAAPQPLR